VERLALAQAVNDEIRALARRLDHRDHEVGWLCACGCFAVVAATVEDFDAAGHVYAPGHPLEPERVVADEAYRRAGDAVRLRGLVDERLRRRLADELAARLEGEVDSLRRATEPE
jgi:hypothetical protein